MVDQTQLVHAAAMQREYQSINQATRMLDNGAKIVAMMIGSPSTDDTSQPSGTLVRTDHFEYPAQMIAGIKQQFTARQEAIRNELREIGVTIVPPRPPTGPPDDLYPHAAKARAERIAARGARPRPAPQPQPQPRRR